VSPHRRRVLAGLTLLLTAAACLALLALYLAWRAREWRRMDVVVQGDLPIAKDAEIGFVPARDAVSVREHPRAGLAYHLFTSDRGARVGRPHERTPPRVDVLFVGCSFTWGHGVEQEETFPALLAERLGVLGANVAFSAYGTVQSVQMFERNLDLRPRLVVYPFIADHLKRNASPCAPAYGPVCMPVSSAAVSSSGEVEIVPPALDLFDLNVALWREFFFRRPSTLPPFATTARAEWARLFRTPRPAGVDDAETRATILTALLRRLSRGARSVGARTMVVHLPYLERGTTNDPPAPLRQALLRLGSEAPDYVDLTPAVRAHYASPHAELLRFERDRHPAPAAHRLVADRLADPIRRRLEP
jgi:hypothetical protein